MNEEVKGRVHWSFWFISAVMLLWNIMGCLNFFTQMNPDMVSSYRETEQAIIDGRPVWATIAFAIAVFGGAMGCIVLMLRKTAAFYLFIASLIGVIVTTIHTLGIGVEFEAGEITGIILMPLVVAVFLIWYSKYVENRGWLRS